MIICWFKNGKVVINAEVSNYYTALNRAGLPQSVCNVLEQVYEERITQAQMKDFYQAKEHIKTKEKTTEQSPKVQNEMDI